MYKHHYQQYYTSQVDERDCGVAALNMIMKYYHSDYSLAHLRQLAKTDLEGTTALGLVKAAEALNFEVSPIKADTSLFNDPELPYPFIAHVKKAEGVLHYYVVFGMHGDSLVIGDPDPTVKLTQLSIDAFATQWSGVALFFAPKPAYRPTHETKHSLWSFVPLLLKQHRLITLIILSAMLITVISIAGSYFVQAIVDTYIPMGMIGTLSVIAIGLSVAYGFQAIFTYAENFLFPNCQIKCNTFSTILVSGLA